MAVPTAVIKKQWEKNWMMILISLNWVAEGPIHDNSALAELMVWCEIGSKPLPERMMILLIDVFFHQLESLILSYAFSLPIF